MASYYYTVRTVLFLLTWLKGSVEDVVSPMHNTPQLQNGYIRIYICLARDSKVLVLEKQGGINPTNTDSGPHRNCGFPAYPYRAACCFR